MYEVVIEDIIGSIFLHIKRDGSHVIGIPDAYMNKIHVFELAGKIPDEIYEDMIVEYFTTSRIILRGYNTAFEFVDGSWYDPSEDNT